jgi:hypothetical protein
MLRLFLSKKRRSLPDYFRQASSSSIILIHLRRTFSLRFDQATQYNRLSAAVNNAGGTCRARLYRTQILQ